MRRSNKSRRNQTKAALPEPISLDIEKFSHDGRGLGRHHGRVVMVTNALPGETVTARIEQANSKLWQARAIEWQTRSEQRLEPACKHFGRCGGCQLQHVAHATQLQLKQDAVSDHLRRNQIDLPDWSSPIESSPLSYRARARFHINKAGVPGFHSANGNDHVAISNCPVLIEPLQQAFDLLKQAPLSGLFQLELVYSDAGQLGIKIIKGRPESVEAMTEWAQQQGWLVSQALNYDAAEHIVTAHPGDFTQVNRPVNAELLVRAKDWLKIKSKDRLLDLFCGNGNFTLPMASSLTAVHGIEGSDSAIERARQAAQSQPQSSFSVENLFSADLHLLEDVKKLQPNLLILDPPRAGAEHICRQLSELPTLERILYVSCDPTTLARDLSHLQQDKWHLRKVALIDMFPQTRHIETMALLEK